MLPIGAFFTVGIVVAVCIFLNAARDQPHIRIRDLPDADAPEPVKLLSGEL